MKNKYSVAIVGVGYVGLPLAYTFCCKNIPTIGIDIDERKKDNFFNQNVSKLCDLDRSKLNKMIANNFTIYTDYEIIKTCNVIIICVPTPLDKNLNPDTSYIKSACKEITPFLKKKDIVVLESTSYPGTTIEIVKPILEGSGLIAGQDFYLAFSPERIMPGNKKLPFNKINKIVGGINKISTSKVVSLYKKILDAKIIKVSSSECAEMVKLLENSYRYINLSFIFEFAKLCDKMHLNIWEVIEAAKTKPVGFEAFYPSLGIGGHCIPIDPIFLKQKADYLNSPLQMIDEANKVLDDYHDYIIKKIEDLVYPKQNILFIGVSYKNGVSDIRESATIKIMKDLLEHGFQVKFFDLEIKEINIKINNELKLFRSEDNIDIFLNEWANLVIYSNYQNLEIEKKIINSKVKIYDSQNLLKKVKKRNNIYL